MRFYKQMDLLLAGCGHRIEHTLTSLTPSMILSSPAQTTRNLGEMYCVYQYLKVAWEYSEHAGIS